MSEQFDRDEFDRLAAEFRYVITDMICRAGSGHLGGALSLVEIVISLYWRIMRYDPTNPLWPERDRLVMSKGHAGPVLYMALAYRGFFPKATLKTMNVSLGDVAEALQVKPAGAAAGAAAPGGKTPFAGLEVPERTYGQAATKPAARRKAAPRKAAAQAATGEAAAVDPMQWWGALTQQFQQIASQAMQDVAQKAAPGQTADAPAPGRGQAAARKGRAPSSPAPAKGRSATRRRSAS